MSNVNDLCLRNDFEMNTVTSNPDSLMGFSPLGNQVTQDL